MENETIKEKFFRFISPEKPQNELGKASWLNDCYCNWFERPVGWWNFWNINEDSVERRNKEKVGWLIMLATV